MYTSVWVVTFMNLQERQFVLGVYSTREKAVQAVERAADDSGYWLNKSCQDYSTNYGWVFAFNDKNMKKQAGTYYITMRDLE